MDDSVVANEAVFIYALRCPVTHDLRYVGQSVNPDKRLTYHLGGKYGNSQTRRWVNKLKRAGAEPILEIIERCDASRADDREDYWIKKILAEGQPLTNQNFRGQTWHSREKWQPQ